MNELVGFTLQGLFLGAAYAIAASGLVLTYTTTRVFNLAQGATSMLMAYLFWQLRVDTGLPSWLAVVLILFVVAPLFGLVLERLVMRGLGEAPVGVSLVTTVALFMLLVGLAIQFWPADKFYSVPYFFTGDTVSILGNRVLVHYVLTIVVSAIVAGALYVLLNRTRTGTAMRAAVDNRELLQLFGASSNRVSMLSWAIGSSLSALAGVLLVAYTGLDYYTLTFLVISSFAAAMLGRLASLPLTFLGALALGLGNAYIQGYLSSSSAYVQTALQSSLPTFLLFTTLIFVPEVRLRVGQVKGILAANVPSGRRSLSGAGALVLAALVVVPLLDPTDQLRFGIAVGLAIVMLSLVLLTGYGGYVSLAQFTFVGVGESVAAKMDSSSPLVLLAGFVIAAAVGAIVSLPVLRLTGLYLALATLAFGQLMDKLVFQADFLYGFGGSLEAQRISILGYDFADTGTYVFLMLAVFLIIGVALLAVRRGAVGRLLIALRDSPAACGTLGLDQRWFRVAVFSLSSGIAGVGGVLLAGLTGRVNAADFATLQSLPLLLVAVVAGVTTVTGAFLGGLLLMLLPVVQATVPDLAGLVFVVIAVGAMLLARDPNGLANLFYRAVRGLQGRVPMPPQLRRFQPVDDDPHDEPHGATYQGAHAEPAREAGVVSHGVA